MYTNWFEWELYQGPREQLEVRFGPLATSTQERLQQWPTERLPELARAFVTAQSLRELGLED